jgi:hypothetical protein
MTTSHAIRHLYLADPAPQRGRVRMQIEDLIGMNDPECSGNERRACELAAQGQRDAG